MKGNRDGAIIMTCDNEQSINIITETVQEKLNEDYEISVLKDRKPRIVITNISEEWSSEDLIVSLKQ